eukprot:167909-Chlamydomonas_euryale.AAC.1
MKQPPCCMQLPVAARSSMETNSDMETKLLRDTGQRLILQTAILSWPTSWRILACPGQIPYRLYRICPGRRGVGRAGMRGDTPG